MSDNQADRGAKDTRDARTQQGPLDVTNWEGPSDLDIDDDDLDDEEESSLNEGIDSLVDPSLRAERRSNNFDVLDLDRSFIIESEEPDFADDPGTTDLAQVVEGDATYFPPTDPPIGVRRTDINGLDGFSDASLNEDEILDHPLRVQGNDEELAEQVRYALATDSYTADLNIEVEVEYGVVYLHGKVGSLDDIDQVEQIASSVPGVEDVEEDLEIV